MSTTEHKCEDPNCSGHETAEEATDWDRRPEYLEHVKPLIDKLYDACRTHKIPMVLITQLASIKDKGSAFGNVIVLPHAADAFIYELGMVVHENSQRGRQDPSIDGHGEVNDKQNNPPSNAD